MLDRKTDSLWSKASSTSSRVCVPRNICITINTNRNNSPFLTGSGNGAGDVVFLARNANRSNTIATDPIMCMVIWLGTRLPSTTSLPNQASKRSKKSTPTESIVFQMLRRTPHTPMIASANTGKPLKAPISLLMNSIHVCTGLKML